MQFYRDLGFLVMGSRLRRLSETFIQEVNQAYAQQGIAFDASWFPVFYFLSQQDEVSIKDIADALNVSHSAMSQLVSALQKKGLVKSVVSAADARRKVITLTAKGKKLLEQIQPVWRALETAMADLAASGKESAKILQALTQIEKALAQESLVNRITQALPND
jgi:DNA-binding MarR family transcriptional regulator